MPKLISISSSITQKKEITYRQSQKRNSKQRITNKINIKKDINSKLINWKTEKTFKRLFYKGITSFSNEGTYLRI